MIRLVTLGLISAGVVPSVAVCASLKNEIKELKKKEDKQENEIKELKLKQLQTETKWKNKEECLKKTVGEKVASFRLDGFTGIYEGKYDWTRDPIFFKAEIQKNLSFCLETIK